MKVICGILVLAFCVQTAISDDLPIPDSPLNLDGWISWAGKFEGDIALTEQQERQIMNGTERNGQIDTRYRWPNGVMPYVFSSDFDNNDKALVLAAIADYTSGSCIRLVERSNEADYIEFIKDGGCWSYVGRIGGKQQISLVNGCLGAKGIIIHEILHAAGFFHEQSRSDRDTYVRVNLENVQDGFQNNFNKGSASDVTAYGEPYDYTSVMHYGEYDFSKNGQKTIEALNGQSPLGQRDGFTQIDLNKLNLMYQCSTTTTTTAATTTTTTGPTTTTTTGPTTTTTTDPTATTTTATTTTAVTTTNPTTVAPACGDAFGSSNCSRWRRLCNRRRYRHFMMDACAETCRYCGANARCVDIHRVVCRRWANAGVCSMAAYQTWMQTYCASSCDVC